MRSGPLLACALLAACFSKPPNNTGGGDAPDAPIDGPPIDPGAPARIATGEKFGCRLSAGEILCWGSNDHTQLGRDDVADFSGNPGRLINNQSDWTSVATGRQHACGVRMGDVYCWGENGFLQSDPYAASTSSSIPITRVALPGGATAERVFAGSFATCALTTERIAYCWGQIDFLTGDLSPRVPRRLTTTTTFLQIALADDHSCALAEDGIVFCWGENEQRATGAADHLASVVYDNARPIESTDRFVSIASDHEASCGITTAGKLVCWGSTNQGQLGTLPQAADNHGYVPTVVDDQRTWSTVAVGYFHTCGISSGDVYCSGYDLDGALGLGTFSGRQTMAMVDTGMKASQLVATLGHTCALSTDGATMKCWGNNGKGELGNKEFTRKYQPTVAAPLSVPIAQLIAGDNHTCALVGAGPGYDAYCWGRNDEGQLGPATSGVVQARPALAHSTLKFSKLAAGEKHTCGIVEGGASIECWGDNAQFQVGSSNDAFSQGNIPAPAGVWTDVAAGSRMSCGIANSDLYCWGERVGESRDFNPVMYLRVSNWQWRSVAVGSGFAIGVAMSGTTPHILGIGSMSKECAAGLANDAVPDPDPLDTWVEVFSGFVLNGNVPMISAAQANGAHGCAHRTDGTTTKVTCWGNPSLTQVGGSLTCRMRDINTVDVSTGWRLVDPMKPAMFATADQTCALDTSNRIKCWGTNSNHELGRIPGGATPTVVFTNQWAAIAGGDDHTCGIAMSDGKVYCWGENQYGQIGDGTSYKPAPVTSGVL
jgi:alpha-tubulin suppressor-like RCC1 family protein